VSHHVLTDVKTEAPLNAPLSKIMHFSSLRQSLEIAYSFPNVYAEILGAFGLLGHTGRAR
jgi:hypothetical protein